MVANSRPRPTALMLHIGGLLGPFAAATSGTILPEIAASFGITTGAASFAIVAYTIPFATLMLVSGPIGERIGTERVVSWAYALLLSATLLAFLSQWWWLFLVALSLAGLANAFTTPLLLSILRQITLPPLLGRAIGLFSSMQALGLLLAPLLSGILAVWSWRYAYLVVAFVSGALLVFSVPRIPATSDTAPRALSYLRFARTYSYTGAIFFLTMCVSGLVPIVVLHLASVWDLAPWQRGVVMTISGITAFAVSIPAGRAVDRWGSRRTAAFAIVFAAASMAAFVPLVGSQNASLPLFSLLWCVTNGAGQAASIALMNLVLADRSISGSISTFQAGRFGGLALTPILLLPLYNSSPQLSYLIAAFGILLSLVLLIMTRPR